MGNISRKDSRGRLAEWARRPKVRGPKFDVFGTSNPELRIAPFPHVSQFTRHAFHRCGACCIDSLG
jgi:hypothetical protein